MSPEEQAALERAAQIADAWETENFRLAGDTILLDPVLRGDLSDAAMDKSAEMQLHGAGHAYAAHAARNIAVAIRALAGVPAP